MKKTAGKDQLQDCATDQEWWDARLDAIGKSRSQVSAEFDPGSRNWLQKILSGYAGTFVCTRT